MGCGSRSAPRAVPLFIETIQFFIGRIADIDDVLMNSLGALVGFMLFQFGFRLVSSLCKDGGVIADKRERRRIGN